MLSRFAFFLITALFLAGGVTNATEPTPPATQASQPQEKTLKPKVYRFEDRNGQTIELLVHEQGIKLLAPKGKAALLMFYIHTGSPCRHELQLFSRLAPQYKDLAIITFELKGLAPEGFPTFEKELGIKGLHMIDSTQARPFAQFLAQITGWTGAVPLIIAIDKEGHVKHMQLGAMDEAQLKKLLSALQA
jgi:peroxiredoxin